MNGPPRDCANCGAFRPHYARGLCAACYNVDWSRRQAVPTDVDEVAVLRVVQLHDQLALCRADRIEAVRRLTSGGWSAAGIARLLGCSWRTVQRDRQALRTDERASA